MIKKSNQFKYALNGLILLGFLTIPAVSFAAGAPTVTTHPASYIHETYANLNGFFDPNGNLYTARWFEWGASSSNLNQSANYSNFSGTQAEALSRRISGLDRDAVYYFRAAAQNEHGIAYGATLGFKTGPNPVSSVSVFAPTPTITQTQQPVYYSSQPAGTSYGYYAPTLSNAQPVAITHLPTSITQTSATFNGSLVLNSNLPTDAWFEWGITNQLGGKTPARQIATQIGTFNFDETVTGLNPDTLYYVQAVAKNANGASRGNMFSLRTLSIVAAAPASSSASEPAPKPEATPAPKLQSEPETIPDEIAEEQESQSENRPAAAGIFFAGLFPDSLTGWLTELFMLLLAFLAGWHARRIYERNLREKAAKERERKLHGLEEKPTA